MEHTQRSWRAWRLPVTPVNCILGKGDAMTSKRNVEPPKAKGSPVVEELLREKKGSTKRWWRGGALLALPLERVKFRQTKLNAEHVICRGKLSCALNGFFCFAQFVFYRVMLCSALRGLLRLRGVFGLSCSRPSGSTRHLCQDQELTGQFWCLWLR